MAGKRAHGEGTMYQRANGLWCGQLTTPEGQRKTFYAKTQADLRKKLTAARSMLDAGLPVVSERQTVSAYLTTWLATIQPTVKARSYMRYDAAIRIHIAPSLGHHKLARLKAQHIQTFYAAALAGGASAATVAHLHAVLHRALKDAARLDLVPRNVADLVTAPRPTAREERVLSQEHAQTLLQTAHGERLEALYTLALTTGMRLGELLALHWEDVDLDAATLQVRQTLYYDKGGVWRLDTPKTDHSRRRIDLGRMAIEALRRHRVRQAEERLAIGEAWGDHGFVFTRVDGEPLRGPHVLERHFLPLLKRAGLPPMRFHDLRHTAATLMLLGDVRAKVVSEMLGHSNIAITLGLYSHVTPTMQRDAAATMDRLLGS